ncbi:hypothetical protein A2881_04605 [Candidatus Peribacteria bacterium RIFCSPHIGHO2_01_FULL_55_13]|nr:MAG: hypothetical protein A2881_04605 [Candidatus Peribacteria bacterium RIFCSPHIGHO2_01_FULL_55_13]
MTFEASSPSDENIIAKKSLLSAATLVRGRHGIIDRVSEDEQLDGLGLDSLAVIDMIEETQKLLVDSNICFLDTSRIGDAFEEAMDNDWTLQRLAQRIMEQRAEEASILELTQQGMLRPKRI